MTKLLVVLLVVAVALWALLTRARGERRCRDARGEAPAPPRPSAAPGQSAQDMVRCAHCGVHLPKGESITAGQQHFCSDAHRLAHMDKTEPS